ncbi:hypothetical protein BJ742DRAFT_827985 [Cladochytrium replicatum]|nr:hypothetical protein BJ742DRAFT_827985 [Cladochytrium replicatum]
MTALNPGGQKSFTITPATFAEHPVVPLEVGSKQNPFVPQSTPDQSNPLPKSARSMEDVPPAPPRRGGQKRGSNSAGNEASPPPHQRPMVHIEEWDVRDMRGRGGMRGAESFEASDSTIHDLILAATAAVSSSSIGSAGSGNATALFVNYTEPILGQQTSDSEVSFNKALREFKDEMNDIKAAMDECRKQLFVFKSQQLDIEEQLLNDGKHPELLAALQDIEDRNEARIQIARDRLRHAVESTELHFDASLQLARDSFYNARSRVRREIIEDASDRRFQLIAEYERYQAIHSCGGSSTPQQYNQTPEAVHRKRIREVEGATHARSGLAQGTEESGVPDWVRRDAKRRRCAKEKALYVPSVCAGLNDNEKDEDLFFIRLLSTDVQDNGGTGADGGSSVGEESDF